MGDPQARYEREQAFHDHVHGEEGRERAGKFYVAYRRGEADYVRRLLDGAGGRHVLELGCGTGVEAFTLAERGDEITGIDLSSVAVEAARQEAGRRGIAGLRYLQMNAEHLDLVDGSVDLVFGNGVLHHLDLHLVLPELARVLTPFGRAVFIEPSGHNPLINLYRRATPSMRTDDEHPLLVSDLRLVDSYFRRCDVGWHHLASLLAVPFHNRAGLPRLLDVLDAADRRLLRLPGVRRMAWTVVIDAAEPRRTGT